MHIDRKKTTKMIVQACLLFPQGEVLLFPFPLSLGGHLLYLAPLHGPLRETSWVESLASCFLFRQSVQEDSHQDLRRRRGTFPLNSLSLSNLVQQSTNLHNRNLKVHCYQINGPHDIPTLSEVLLLGTTQLSHYQCSQMQFEFKQLSRSWPPRKNMFVHAPSRTPPRKGLNIITWLT